VDSEPHAAKVTPAFPTPPAPTTTSEYVTVLAHFHRAEIARMAGWRDRIDRTTNWAITGGGAMLSLTLSTPTSHHGVLLFTILLVLLFLIIEARRYRFFDVYRARVRLIERHFFAPVFAGSKSANSQWAQALAASLDKPTFLISLRVAMSRRLRRNYIWIFVMLLLSWILKLATPKLQAEGTSANPVFSIREIVDNASLGHLPGWIVIAAVAVFYGWLVYTTFFAHDKEDQDGDVHV
jgi:uncharacterized membrane protein